MSVTSIRTADNALAGQTVLVTGAGRGIGRAIAIRFAASGAAVVCCSRTLREVESTADLIRQHGGRAIARHADVRDEFAVEQLAQAAVEQFGALNLAVLNAGVAHPHMPVDTLPTDTWQETIDIDLTGVFFCLRAVIPHMRESGGGKILVVGSGAWRRAPLGHAAYVAAKAGVSALVRVAARELRADHIAINELQPGPTATAIQGVTESDPDTLAARFVVLEEGLEDDASIAGEWYKAPSNVADIALVLMRLPVHGPSGQTFSLNSAI